MNQIEHIKERDDDLIRLYFHKLKTIGKSAAYMNKIYIVNSVVESPAPRFYCSIEEAQRNCSKILRGQSINRRNSLKNQMYIDICEKIENYKIKHPNMDSLQEIISDILYNEAPKFYISVCYAIRIINKSYSK